MQKIVRFAVVVAWILTVSGTAAAQGRRPFDPPPARTSQPQPGGTLTPPSTDSRGAVLARYLRGQGRSEAVVGSLTEASQAPGRGGVTQAQFEQRVTGLTVYGTYAKAVFSSRGELLHLIENLASVPAAVGQARVTAQQAVSAAIANLYPELRSVPAGFFRSAPSAQRVAIPHDNGSMSVGFLVETWTQRSNELFETLVDGDGSVLGVESRTSRDSYRVFRISPERSTQDVVTGPAPGGTESPAGWLFSGVQGSTHIQGNNANAYLDAVSNNRSDSEGSAVADGNFLTVFDGTVSPSTPSNKEVAVQNLFYLNNLIHDELYRHGFNEGAGNFQESNFGRGGRGSDSVLAEAQDGGGTDNANFATPSDGRNPRMQMYLWNPAVTHDVVVNSPAAIAGTYGAKGAEFGPALSLTGLTGDVVLGNDGTGTATDGCEALQSVAGMIVLLDRGTCAFTIKVKNAQDAGAVAAIVANNQGDSLLTMGGDDPSISIPSVFIGQTDGGTLRSAAGVNATIRLANNPPPMRDGDLDSDIVFHEYGHGLTWRMIGRMSGPLAGAVGEGMSDVVALIMNEDDRVGEYSFSDSRGIRRFPYAGYPLTYSDVTGAEVHNDGEIYGAIGWRLVELFGLARKETLFGYMVDGMNYTPAKPTYEQMRDGILASVANSAEQAGDPCLVWQAFAQYGVGVGAKSVARGSRVTITESFALPAECSAP